MIPKILYNINNNLKPFEIIITGEIKTHHNETHYYDFKYVENNLNKYHLYVISHEARDNPHKNKKHTLAISNYLHGLQ